MNSLIKLTGAVALVPLFAFAAPTPITDWGFERNGDVRVTVENKTIYVSPSQEKAYFEALMAARLMWPVEINNGALVIDKRNVPLSQISLVSPCADENGEFSDTCTYQPMTLVDYACLLNELDKYVSMPIFKVSNKTWPPLDENGMPPVGLSTAAFSINGGPVNYKGNYNISVDYVDSDLALHATVVEKPVGLSYQYMWAMVDMSYAACQ